VNNDAYCAEKIGKYHVFGVAEGLSDPDMEGTASSLAISCLRETMKKHQYSPGEILEMAIRESDARISEQLAKLPKRGRDKTHMSACLIDNDVNCTILDTGEGNTYVIDTEGILIPHEFIKARKVGGTDYSDQKHGKEERNTDMISHTLGEPRILTNTDFILLNLTNRFLLMSSGGLHDFVKKERIAEIILKNGENVETSCQLLLEEALSAGSEQTITLILVHGHLH